MSSAAAKVDADIALRQLRTARTEEDRKAAKTKLRGIRNRLTALLREYDAMNPEGGARRMGLELAIHQIRLALK